MKNNLKEILNRVESALAQTLEKLGVLEKEKQELLNKGKNIDKKIFWTMNKKLAESEIKYINLLEEVQELSKKIKFFKSKFS